MSVPCSTSGRSVEASRNASSALTGRRLMNRSSSLRMRNSWSTFLCSAGILSYSGDPMAPNRIASLSSTACHVLSRIRLPCFFHAGMPNSSSRTSMATPRLAANQRTTRKVCATISEPMPSPGSTRIFFATGLFRLSVDPRPRRFVGGAECFYGNALAERHADVVQAGEQRGAALRLDLEPQPAAGRRRDRALLEVDADPGLPAGRELFSDRRNFLDGQAHRQQ